MYTKESTLVQKECLCSLEQFKDSLVRRAKSLSMGKLGCVGKKVDFSTVPDTSRQIRRGKTVDIRKEEVMAIRNRFPTKIPIIVQRFAKETNLPKLDKTKFLVPQEITMSQFLTIIRNRMRINSSQTLYLLINNRSMMSLSLTLAEVYCEHAGPDGFLYITYASQEVFGGTKIHV